MVGDGADNVRTYLARTGGEGQPSSVMLSNPDLAAAFKTSVYNTVQFSAATSKAMGMTREPSPCAHPSLCVCSELQQLGLLLQLPPHRDGERHHPGGRPLQPVRPRHRRLALAAARVVSHVYYQHSSLVTRASLLRTPRGSRGRTARWPGRGRAGGRGRGRGPAAAPPSSPPAWG